MTILTIIVAGRILCFVCYPLRRFDKDDLGYIPGGTRLAYIMNRCTPRAKALAAAANIPGIKLYQNFKLSVLIII